MRIPNPVFRRLRGYSFDPSLSAQLDTALVNEAVFKIDWENTLLPGPIGEYVEVIDYDPASRFFYEPVDLNDPRILAQDGLSPSEGNPQFHQQMAYAVAMTTIKNFEKALGRKALWSPHRKELVASSGSRHRAATVTAAESDEEYVQRLRIYPHALRQANAYYSPAKKALLFGYFPAVSESPGEFLPNGLVFTALSHDIIAHETTHALLDGMHRRFIEASHKDTLAFHEGFADIVALFQHFSFPEVLKHQIAKTRGRLDSQNLLGELAQQFGKAIGQYGALRSAIGETDPDTLRWAPKVPDPDDYQTLDEPHDRGALLVAAVFETFIAIYKRRIADLLRLATDGTGVLSEGELHPDLVNRLANEASKCSKHILNMCIRALDYCPPVDISFGDYLRAIITADIDLVPNDEMGYRIALIDAFKRRGIYPRDIRTLSPESLSWERFEKGDTEQLPVFERIAQTLRAFVHQLDYLDGPEPQSADFDSFGRHFSRSNRSSKKAWKDMSEREKIFVLTEAGKGALAELLVEHKRLGDPGEILKFEEVTGLRLLQFPENHEPVNGLEFVPRPGPNGIVGNYVFEVHSIRGARRFGPDGNSVNQVIISITQERMIPLDKTKKWDVLTPKQKEDTPHFRFRGGCTLILDLQDLSLRYAIVKDFADKIIPEKGLFIENERLTRLRNFKTGVDGMARKATYFGSADQSDNVEPFALLHRNF